MGECFFPQNMPHSFGTRARTRDTYTRGFRKNGPVHTSQYIRVLKVGDYVDIKTDSSIQKGMPYKHYHGRTGVIWNVTRNAYGIECNKPVGNKILKKRFHIRREHVQPSRCREEFLNRVKTNDAAKREAKKALKAGNKFSVPNVKRQPAQPRPGYTVRPVVDMEFEHTVEKTTGGKGAKKQTLQLHKTKVVSKTKQPAEILEQIRFEFIA